MPDVHNGCATVATSDNCALRREDEVLQPLLEVVNRYEPWTQCVSSVTTMQVGHCSRRQDVIERSMLCEHQVSSILFARPKAMRHCKAWRLQYVRNVVTMDVPHLSVGIEVSEKSVLQGKGE